MTCIRCHKEQSYNRRHILANLSLDWSSEQPTASAVQHEAQQYVSETEEEDEIEPWDRMDVDEPEGTTGARDGMAGNGVSASSGKLSAPTTLAVRSTRKRVRVRYEEEKEEEEEEDNEDDEEDTKTEDTKVTGGGNQQGTWDLL